ncbi:MAG TPA: hypothetical protein VNO32_54160 [Candidatus Acidoferrum sp.]|jgi:hypothetical protein|nr:hypothetical protein [Candidatus Acidoferrum sp.]
MGRKRKYKSDAARYRAYRLRQKQLGILLMVENPEPGSLPWHVQVAECTRLLQGKKPCVANVKVRQKVRERMEALLPKAGLA